ncbi:hypothetical protein [Streptomyces sp. NPDC002520]
MGVDLGAFFSRGDGWGEPWVLDVWLIESLRCGVPDGHTDLTVAIALTRLLYDGTVPVVVKTHRAVLERLALKAPTWPFRTFDGPRGFGIYWRENGMSGSWQARRNCVEQILGPTRDALEELQELEYQSRFRKGPAGHRRREAGARAAGRGEQRRGDRPQRARLPDVHRSAAAARAHLAADGRLVYEEPPIGCRREDRRERPVPASVPKKNERRQTEKRPVLAVEPTSEVHSLAGRQWNLPLDRAVQASVGL